MCHHQDRLPRFDVGQDLLHQQRQSALHGVLEGLRHRDAVGVQVSGRRAEEARDGQRRVGGSRGW